MFRSYSQDIKETAQRQKAKLKEPPTERDDGRISTTKQTEKARGAIRDVVIREDVFTKFADLFGSRLVNSCSVNVQETIGTLSNELNSNIAFALAERRKLLESNTPVSKKFAFPSLEEKFQDVVSGQALTFRQILQGLIDNFLGRKTELAWRLNDEVPIPDDAHPLGNPGLELTGPWHPLDMAIKQINADVAAMMGPDDEDAAPADYVPIGSPEGQAVGLFVSRNNELRLLAGEIHETTVEKKGEMKIYRINKRRDEWPTSFHRVPGIHLLTSQVTVNSRPVPAIIVDYVIHALNDYGALKAAGSSLYYYQPKVQNPLEARIVANLVWKLEQIMGAKKPGTFIKFKALYEEGNLGRYLPVVMWIWRHWLIGTNVGRWDYTGSLIEMWKDERALPDPQNGALMGMTSPHMMAYQRYNALTNLMAGMKGRDQKNGAPIGGMAAVMLYPDTDPYARNRHNPVTLRAMKMDKLRERLIGLIFVPEEPYESKEVTLSDILELRVKGKLYDAYRQSWVATPDKKYVEAGNAALRTPLEELQSMLDSPEAWERVEGKEVAPKIESGLTLDERRSLTGLRLVNDRGRITPWVITTDMIDEPEKFFLSNLWGKKGLWDSLYDIPKGDLTIENVQHAFYMCANYGFQVLNGNLAAAIDDYKIVPNRVVRFMNDLATYRIFVGWLWTVVHLRAVTTRDGFLKGPILTEDGVIPAENSIKVEEGTAVTHELFDRLWQLHNEWTRAFFEDYDRIAAIRISAGVIVDRQRGNALPRSDREHMIEKIVQLLASVKKTVSSGEISNQVASIVAVTPSVLEKDIGLISHEIQMTQILSKAYGRGTAYIKEINLDEAAAEISKILGIDFSHALHEIRGAAPRFDRSKAPIIMDVLRRQILSSRYIQHSPRVLFVIADKPRDQRSNILDAVYYVDKNGTPLFRDVEGHPSRDKIVDAVRDGRVSRDVLQIHDYVYDVFPETDAIGKTE